MIWIVLIFALLCIVMSCVALWYRSKCRQLRESLPKRDSKGRFCKREEEKCE